MAGGGRLKIDPKVTDIERLATSASVDDLAGLADGVLGRPLVKKGRIAFHLLFWRRLVASRLRAMPTRPLDVDSS